MGGQISTTVLKNQNWAKCGIAAEIHLKNNLLEILHNKNNDPRYVGLPEEPAALYIFFQNNKGRIGTKASKKKVKLFPDQIDIILPKQGNQVNSEDCDITLIVALIYGFIIGCPFLQTVDEVRVFRNNLKHGTLDDFKTEQQLQTKVGEIRRLLALMNYTKLQDFDDMVNDDKFLIDMNEGFKHLSTLIATLKNELKRDCDDKIDHAIKILMTDILNQLKPRLKGILSAFQPKLYYNDTFSNF